MNTDSSPQKESSEAPLAFRKPRSWKKDGDGKLPKAKKQRAKKPDRCLSEVGPRGHVLQCQLNVGHGGKHTYKLKEKGWTTLYFWDRGGANLTKYRYEDQRSLFDA